jgi:hypothetical protein
MVSIGNIKKYNIFAYHSIQLERWIWNRFGKFPYFPETDFRINRQPGKVDLDS